MSSTSSARRRLAAVALPVAGLVALLGASACSTTEDPAAVSASGTRQTTPANVGTSGDPGTTALMNEPSTSTTSTSSSASSGGSGSSSGGSPTTTAKSGGAPVPTTPPTTAAPSTAPVVTSVHGPATADCEGPTGMVSITVTYTAANAKYVEYLSPSADRPGADAATGSVLFNYDCTQASQVFKVRAFNEFNGSDAKDPSPYVSVTVNRKIVGGASTTTTAAH